MKVCVLQSSSSGNMTYIESLNHKIVIDVGKTYRDFIASLENINVDPHDIDSILITHSHNDHTGCLGSVKRKLNPNIYMNEEVYNKWNKEVINYINFNDKFWIDNISIVPIALSHDVPCYGFLIDDGECSLVYITDTGYINQKYFKLLTNKNIYIMESNHDVELEMNGFKDYQTKIRNIGDTGHLSNEQCGIYLKKLIGSNTKNIILAHISEDDNDYDLAYKTVANLIETKAEIIVSLKKDNIKVVEYSLKEVS